MGEQHRHVVVWPSDMDLYCLECEKPLHAEEAKNALASCESCGEVFEPATGMFELGEYSYCSACNNNK